MVPLKGLLGSIMLARRNISFESEKPKEKGNDLGDVDGKYDKQTLCEIDCRMDELMLAISNFRPRK